MRDLAPCAQLIRRDKTRMKIWNMVLGIPVAMMIAIPITLLACSTPVETKAKDEPSRFEYQRAFDSEAIDTYVMTDTVTGVQYAVIFGERFGHISIGVTPLLDVNGRPYKEVG